MKAIVILSFLILPISCGEVVKKSPDKSLPLLSQAETRTDSLEIMIADLERELQRFREHGDDSHPVIDNLTYVIDSLEALLP
jgi:hypothetical protein